MKQMKNITVHNFCCCTGFSSCSILRNVVPKTTQRAMWHCTMSQGTTSGVNTLNLFNVFDYSSTTSRVNEPQTCNTEKVNFHSSCDVASLKFKCHTAQQLAVLRTIQFLEGHNVSLIRWTSFAFHKVVRWHFQILYTLISNYHQQQATACME